MPEFKIAESIVSSEYTFALLFIIVLYVFYKWINKNYDEHKADSKERENKLMVHLEKSNETQERTSRTLEKIEGSLHSLEKRMDDGFNDVWEKIEKFDK
ncbi:hypothetical protein AF332_11150 [Sporosarcina globispora]|uniref:Uncharacterized protein n=1 Tax=Sporosarcina globispora TaxID=1459 RepID=A0A0M0GCQ9_SPOGL|nr:hypothetical protein [Sporosarcina globispora]KON87327.1 hypothetical protein AF332_11150 [Sporosarcina globispora]